MSVPNNQRYGQIRRGRMAADLLREQFTQISNAALRDDRLSFKARGVLAWLASHQDGYGCSVAAIETASAHDGRDAIRSALKELQQLGYLTMQQTRDPETGRVGPSDYVVSDIPSTENPSTVPTSGNTASSQVSPVNGLAVDGKSPTKNTRPKNTSKNTVSPSSSSAPKPGRVLDDDDAKTTGMNPDQVHELVAWTTSTRGDWHEPGVRSQILEVAHLSYATVTAAVMQEAANRAMRTPANIASAARELHASEGRRVAAQRDAAERVREFRREVAEDRKNRADAATRAARAAEAKKALQEARAARPETPAASRRTRGPVSA